MSSSHFTQGFRSSGASTSSSLSDRHLGSNAPDRAIAFSTAEHGVVRVNLDDLTSALGVRRADVVSHRLGFQAQSAPAYRPNRTLLGTALSATVREGRYSPLPPAAVGAPGVSASEETLQNSLGTIVAALPCSDNTLGYQRRCSTLRGTQLNATLPPLSLADTRRSPSPERLPPPAVYPDGLVQPPGDLPSSSNPAERNNESVLRLPPAHARGATVPAVDLLRGGASPRARLESGPLSDGDTTENPQAPLLGSASSHGHRHSSPLSEPFLASPTSRPASSSSSPGENVALQTGELEASQAPTRSRRVHFSDEVIQSIHVARCEDEYMHLVVVYSRPWYAYALLSFFGLLLGLTLGSVTYLEEVEATLKARASSVSFMLFLVVGSAALVLAVHVSLCWRPDDADERSFFEDADQLERVPQLWFYSVLFLCCCAAAVACGQSTSCTATMVIAVALVSHLVAEHSSGDAGGDCVTRWDALGCALVTAGAASMTIGGAAREAVDDRTSTSTTLFFLVGWMISATVAGVCWACFTRRLRDMSQRVSQQFLLSTSLIVSTAVLGIGAYVTGELVTSDEESAVNAGAGMKAVWPLPEDSFFPCHTLSDVLIFLGGSCSSIACWYVYHAASFFVDHVAGTACMVVGTVLSAIPLVMLQEMYRTWPLLFDSTIATVFVVATTAGAVLAVAGAALVIWVGFRCRREAEIRIVVE